MATQHVVSKAHVVSPVVLLQRDCPKLVHIAGVARGFGVLSAQQPIMHCDGADGLEISQQGRASRRCDQWQMDISPEAAANLDRDPTWALLSGSWRDASP